MLLADALSSMKQGIKITLILFVMLSLLPCVVQAQRTDDAVVQLQKLNASYNAIVNLTGMDEVNMITSLYGSNHGIPKNIPGCHGVSYERKDRRGEWDALSQNRGADGHSRVG